MKKAKTSMWIEKQIDLERKTSILVLTVLSCTFGLMALLLIIIAFMPHFEGVSRLDTREKVERFSEKNYMDAILVYNTALDLQGAFTVSSNENNALSIFMNGAYIKVPLPESPTEKEYHVWRLTGDGYTVLYCAEGLFEDAGYVHVQTQYRNLNLQIIRNYAPDEENVYVLYDAGSQIPFTIALACSSILAIFFLLIRRARIFRKRTHLGKVLAILGDYDVITHEINRQALHPQFENSGCTILRDWILFRSYHGFLTNASCFTTIVPISDVTNINIKPDEDDEDLFVCTFTVMHYEKPFIIYLDSKDATEIETLNRVFQRPAF